MIKPLGALFAALLLTLGWWAGMPVAYAQKPGPSINSKADFQATLHAAAVNVNENSYNPQEAQRLIEAAVQWARANPGQDKLELITALNGAGNIFNLTKDYVKTESYKSELLATIDTVTEPYRVVHYLTIRSLLQLRWHSGKRDSALQQLARRFIELGPDMVQYDVQKRLQTPDGVPPGEIDRRTRPAKEPYQEALRAVQTDVNVLMTLLLGSPDATPDLASGLVMRHSIIQEAITGLRAHLSEAEQQAPKVPDALGTFKVVNGNRNWPDFKDPLEGLRVNAAVTSQLAYANPHIRPDRLPLPLDLQHERADYERDIVTNARIQWGAETIDAIQHALPEGTVALEYVAYSRLATEGVKLEPPRYALVVVTPTGAPKVLDIGPVAQIDGLIALSCRATISSAMDGNQCAVQTGSADAADVQTINRQLFDFLIGPAASVIAQYGHVIVSPDGALNFYPFEMLVDPAGKFLIATKLVSYVQSIREIPSWKRQKQSSHGPPVVIGDPSYGGATPQPSCVLPAPAKPKRSLRTSSDLLTFERLCASGNEAQRVRDVLPGARLLTGDEATEEAVKGLWGPRILHVATHGFAVKELPFPDSWLAGYPAPWRAVDLNVMQSDPMLRAGLALAGSNVRQSPGGLDDGMLSAAEVSLLNLNGTQLVVLSACDSGLGLPRAGEGVFGLRKAFSLAGARAQTFALWPLDDKTVSDFMTRYYALLVAGRTNTEALAMVKRDLVATGAEPWQWAVFVGYGDPGALGQ